MGNCVKKVKNHCSIQYMRNLFGKKYTHSPTHRQMYDTLYTRCFVYKYLALATTNTLSNYNTYTSSFLHTFFLLRNRVTINVAVKLV